VCSRKGVFRSRAIRLGAIGFQKRVKAPHREPYAHLRAPGAGGRREAAGSTDENVVELKRQPPLAISIPKPETAVMFVPDLV
jgi:hypothetical protein